MTFGPGVDVTQSGALVVRFFYRGDDSRLMRVVVAVDNDVAVEEHMGLDALGGIRWRPVDLDDDEDMPSAWVGMVAAAIAWAYRERIPSRPSVEQIMDAGRSEGFRECAHRLAAVLDDEPRWHIVFGEVVKLRIGQLHRQGMSDEDIAAAVGWPLSNVETVLAGTRCETVSSVDVETLRELAEDWAGQGQASWESDYERGETVAWRLAAERITEVLDAKPNMADPTADMEASADEMGEPPQVPGRPGWPGDVGGVVGPKPGTDDVVVEIATEDDGFVFVTVMTPEDDEWGNGSEDPDARVAIVALDDLRHVLGGLRTQATGLRGQVEAVRRAIETRLINANEHKNTDRAGAFIEIDALLRTALDGDPT